MIQIQTTIAGYTGTPCTVFSAYDPSTRILVVAADATYRTDRREGCILLTNIPDVPRDFLFTDDLLAPAIRAFYALKGGIAADNASARLAFSDRAARANPENIIEQDGIDIHGPKYRISAGATNAQMAALATCFYAVKSDTVERTVQMAEALSRLSAGDIVTI